MNFSLSSHLPRNYNLTADFSMTRNCLGRMNSPGTKEMFPRLSPEPTGHAVAGTSGEVFDNLEDLPRWLRTLHNNRSAFMKFFSGMSLC